MTYSQGRTVLALALMFTGALVGPSILFAQGVTAEQLGAAEIDSSANEWGGALVWAFFSSSALEYLKRKKWFNPLSEKTAWGIQRGVGLVLAIAAALGVHWAFDPSAGRLVIDGLVPASLWTMGTEATRQWVLQELTYRTAVKTYKPETTL